MVFEKIVTDVINKFLGEYVENLDKNQLKIGIWGGDVVLHNLKLRENALDDLDLPVQLIYGYLGKLVLKIPWKKLYSEPVIAQIEDLYALVSPKQEVEYNEEKEEKYELLTKQTALNAFEEANKKKLTKDQPKPDATFAEKLTAQIVNNLQIKISNVHLRYEDSFTTGKPFAFGVSLHDLEIYTTDLNWEKCYMTEQQSRVYKIANLDSLSVYMNCNAKLFGAQNSDLFADMFRENIASKELLPARYNYILGPISSLAKLQLNMNPEYDDPPFKIPKIDLSLDMEKLNIGLTSSQFQDILKLGDAMNRLQLGAPYRKFRPFQLPYKGNYKQWWQFAITAVKSDIIKRNRTWTWQHMKEHRELCEAYAQKHKEKELCKKPTATLLEACTLLEAKLDLFNLLLVRQRVQIEVEKIKAEEVQTVKQAGWFGGWFGRGKADENAEGGNIVKQFEAAMTPDEKAKLYKAIGYQENAAPQDLPDDYEAINMNFTLFALEIGLYDDRKEQKNETRTSYDYHDLQTIMLLNFSMAKCSIQQRPASSGLCVNAGMQEMRLTGLKRDDFTPTLIESKFTHELNLLDILFEMNPIDKLCDQRIKVRARPLHVVYDSETIMRLMSVFSPPKTVNLSELEGAATAQMANFKERSATGMQYMIEKRTILDVDIQFMPNLLIIPETGRYEEGKQSLIVISLGQLNVRAKPRKSFGNDIESMFGGGHDQAVILKNIMEKAYDNYRVSIDDIQVLVSRAHEPWNDILQQAQVSEMHVLRPTSIIVEAGLCVVDDDPRLPKTKVNILLPSIDVNITEERVFEALHVLTSLPLPEGQTDVAAPLKKSISSMSIRKSLPNFLTQDRKGQKKQQQQEAALIEEIVQYTNLELNFALKEIKVVLYKSSGLDLSRDSSESTKFGTPVEDDATTTRTEEEFEDTQSQVVTARDSSVASSTLIVESQEKIILLQVLQLEAEVVQRTYETIATAKLGAVNLTQYDYFEGKPQELSIIDTPRFSQELEYLLTVSYKMADKKSPEFTTKYASTEQLINVHFSTLNVTLHQECLLHLLAIADSLQRKLDSVTKKSGPQDRMASAADESIVGKLAVILEEEHAPADQLTAAGGGAQAADATQRRSTRSTKVVDSIRIHVVANLEQFAVLLTCRKRPLAMLQVQHFNAGVIMKSSYTELNLRLKDILVNDMNPKNIHTNILSIVGQDALNCQIVMYNLNETSDYNANDMQINVEIGCMKIVFLNWFVTSVLKFVSNFQAAQQALANASAAAADVAMQNAMDAYEKASRMKLNIKIKAPLIVVPVDSQSFNALVLDLGSLLISNTTSEVRVPGNARSPAVIDDIKLEMKDLKLSKASILEDAGAEGGGILFDRSLDTIDLAYGLKSNVNILDPISCALQVKRNLSSSWYKDVPELDVSGRLQSIELNIFMEDYGLIMSILNRNLNEGANEFPSAEEAETSEEAKPPPTTQRKPSDLQRSKSESESPSRVKSITRRHVPIVSHNKQKVHEQMKFSFQFDGVVANFMSGPNDGLARFAIYFLSVKGCKLVDGTLSTSVRLCNIQLDDTRRNTTSKITQYLCRKDWNKRLNLSNPTQLAEESPNDVGYMLDLTAIIKENDTFAEIRVSGFDLILCIDFLLKLTDFCKVPEDDTPLEGFEPAKPAQVKAIEAAAATKTTATSSRPASAAAVTTPKPSEVKKMNLILRVDEPDIILVESLEDINTNAIIFNAEAQLNYRTFGEKQIINGQIDGLKMFMCSFMPERREATKHYIIHPCVISLQGSTPENEGLHISLKLSEIIINVSPATIELLNKANATISRSTAEKVDALKMEANYSHIWNAQKFKDKDYWFVKIDEAEDAYEMLCSEDDVIAPLAVKTEKCVIEVPCITLVFESGVGYYTTPLISIDTKLNAVVSDWSRELGINGSLTLSVNYYNEALAVWEPIVEPNEQLLRTGELVYLPWELSFNMSVETKVSEFDENIDEKTTKIKIHSEENLEVTISKTCLNLLRDLGDAFSQAIDAKGLVKPEVIAPYVVENDTGFDITVNFQRGIFTLHQCHMPNISTPNSLNNSIVFQADQLDAQLTPELVKDCRISAGGRAYLQTKDLSTLTNDEDEEYNIFVKIGDINKEVCLPVSKSDKRYFSLMRGTNQDAWGIVSEVLSEFGTTKINIHGVVNVQNHFTTAVSIYRRNPKTMEKILVGEVAPGQVFHVPLHAIYADQKELYFAVTDYNVSVQGMRWTDCPTDLNYSHQLQCDPIDTYEPLYINAIREKKEIFYENTNKFKLQSAFYTIHLRPPLYLRNALPINVKVSVAGCTVHQNGKAANAIMASSATDINEIDKSNGTLAKEELLDYGEKEVMPGDCLHLPTVKLSGRTTETRSFLVVRLIQYLEKDWSCTTEIQQDNENVTATWKFSAYDSAAKMDMDLLARYENRNGSLMVTLYSPFWMINKTGLMLSYKTDTETVDVLYHPPEYDGPILFSFREKFFFDKKSASIRVDNGEWSDKIPLDVAGSTGAVTCRANDLSYQIGVHNHLTHNSLTKQITFIPFYIATNKCEFPIELQELSRPADPWMKIEPNSCLPMWPKNDSDHMIVARIQGQRTAPFKYAEELCTLLQLNANKYGGINVDIQVTEGGIYINFTEYNPGDAPGLLINHSSQPVIYHEKGSSKEHVLQPHHRILYTWADATGDKCIIFGRNRVENDLRRDGVGELIQEDSSKAYWVSFLDGLQRILLFTEVEEIATKSESSAALQTITQSLEVRIHGIGLSVVDNEAGVDIMYLGITSSGIIWESKKENKNRYKQMNIHDTAQIEGQYQQYLINKSLNHQHTYYIDSKHEIDFDRMILNKNGLRMIRRTFQPGVWVDMNTSPFQTQLHAKINKIQLDNQLIDPIFPVVLAPIAPPKSVATTTAMKPFIECSVVQRVVPNSNVKQFKYASMLIQEFHFKVDLLFLTAIANMFAARTSDDQAAKLFNDNVESISKPLSDLVETHSMQEQKNFYDNLHLGPLKIHVSFSMAGSDTTALPGILSTLVQGVGVTLTDVNDVVFRLAFFEREYRFFTQQQLTSEITAHYTGQALKQLYVLVLGLDVLGNPYGLVVGLKKGVEDLFYEPFQGAIQGPGEFAEGLVLGVKSLFGHTVGGAAGAVSKITGAMGKGLAALTFDDDYQRKRRQAMNKKPKNFQEGIARSGKGLVMGFVDGVTGVVTKPVTGAREEGFEGFFKGLGKGAIGLVARPTAGVVDFASGSFDAVKRAAESNEDVVNLRPARLLHQDSVLRPYNRAEARGNKLLKEIEKGKYAGTDLFVHCEEVVQKHEFLLVSNHRIIYVTKNDVFRSWTVQWTYLWHEIAAIHANDRGVEITLKKEGKRVLGLFASNEQQKRLVLVHEKTRREKLIEIMESQRREN